MLYMTRVRHEWGVLFMLFLLSRQNGLIAQVVVEQGTENACVGGANPSESTVAVAQRLEPWIVVPIMRVRLPPATPFPVYAVYDALGMREN